ncbi:MAG: coproporphyrinogen dehydrogenase HemZ [Lachnospirales bacterium]
MHIFLRNHDFFHATNSVLQIFFSNVRFTNLKEIDLFKGYDFLILVDYVENLNSFETSVIVENNVVTKVTEMCKDTNVKHWLKISMYKCLCLYTNKVPKWGILTGIRPTKKIYKYIDVISDEKIVDMLSEKYLVDKEKARLTIEVARNEQKVLHRLDENGAHIYISIPFCISRCVYCSFTSFSYQKYDKLGLVDKYVDCLIKELKESAYLFKDKKIVTVYVGGGTPTTLSATNIEKMLKAIVENYDLSHLLEFTYEAGRADTFTRDKLVVLKNFGVNRISINPQSMKQETLHAINRTHSIEEFMWAYDLAREFKFPIINVDIIFGLAGENFQDFSNTLKKVLDLNPECVTIHTLAVKKGSALKEFYQSDEIFASISKKEISNLPLSMLVDKYYIPYYLYRQKNMVGNSSLENIGYSKPGCECIYNIISMEETENIIGFGAGAVTKRIFSDNTIDRAFNVSNIHDYVERTDEMIERKVELYTREILKMEED